MRWRVVCLRLAPRWLEAEHLEAGDLDGFGLELPEGAKVHSIVPAKTRGRPLDYPNPEGLADEEVLEWAVFVALPLEEGAP